MYVLGGLIQPHVLLWQRHEPYVVSRIDIGLAPSSSAATKIEDNGKVTHVNISSCPGSFAASAFRRQHQPSARQE